MSASPLDPTAVPETRDLRVDYDRDRLDRSDLANEPVAQFSQWMADAIAAGVDEPNAFTLATVDDAGRPDARIVLLKGFDERGLRFFTNYTSAKGEQLAGAASSRDEAEAAACFVWLPLHRQVRVRGPVERLSREESAAYFHSRPRGSRLGAVASPQSRVLGSRAELEQAYADAEARFAGRDIPLPDTWGGYRLRPRTVEFWQGRRSRLHDRFRYSADPASSESLWTIDRLAP